jgi:hypothetical protein
MYAYSQKQLPEISSLLNFQSLVLMRKVPTLWRSEDVKSAKGPNWRQYKKYCLLFFPLAAHFRIQDVSGCD